MYENIEHKRAHSELGTHLLPLPSWANRKYSPPSFPFSSLLPISSPVLRFFSFPFFFLPFSFSFSFPPSSPSSFFFLLLFSLSPFSPPLIYLNKMEIRFCTKKIIVLEAWLGGKQEFCQILSFIWRKKTGGCSSQNSPIVQSRGWVRREEDAT